MVREFFSSRGIAVIGASREEGKVGNVIFKNLLESKLKIYPINPNAPDIMGIKAYPDILSIPFSVDLAVIVVKADLVPQVLEQCGQKNVKRVIIISAGFSEAGNIELDNKVREVATKYKIRILGPNVLGIIDPYKNLNATFFKTMPDKGKLSVISQSGALGVAFLDKATEYKLGFSKFIALGNMLDIDFIEALEYLENDPNTDVISLYIESLKVDTGRKFLEICKRISKRKKIIALKAGKTAQGEQAAKTHTASLSSPSAIYSGVFKQAGIIEVNSFEEMFNLSLIHSKYKDLGTRVCIVTNAGGFGVLATDFCIRAGLEVPEIPQKVLEKLDIAIGKRYSRENPVDLIGDALAKDYENALKFLDKEKFFDFFVVILTPQQMTQPLETAMILEKLKKPVIICFIGGKLINQAINLLKEKKQVIFDDVSKLSILNKTISEKKSLFRRFFNS